MAIREWLRIQEPGFCRDMLFALMPRGVGGGGYSQFCYYACSVEANRCTLFAKPELSPTCVGYRAISATIVKIQGCITGQHFFLL